ncbi:MAG: insulinase family protein [Treponema sp.]|nr:insulinase family protein [Treponema sp.]
MIKRKRLCLLFLLALLSAGSLTAASKKKTAPVDLGYSSGKRTENPLKMNSAVKTGLLSNGMDYYLMSNPEPDNRIMLRLVVKTGSCMEDDDQQGVAHLIEHMAFNGTENFKKNEIISFMESVGMKFGADLNAYTSFEQTVYMLEIPADDKAVLEKALLILHDWACAVSFEQEELDKERGVVKEEWRLSQGANQRINEKIFDVELHGSRYQTRMPIGKMDVIDNVSRQRVVDFYEKWYRPELMSIAIVGDLPVSQLEAAVKKVMSTVPASKEKTERPVYQVPLPQDKSPILVKDSEWKYTILQLESRVRDYQVVKTKEGLYENLLMNYLALILNQRFAELAKDSSSPFIAAQLGSSALTNDFLKVFLAINPKAGMEKASFETALAELNRFLLHGATDAELERTKKSYAASIEQYRTGIPKMESYNYINQLVDYAITGAVVQNPADYCDIMISLIDQSNKEDLSAYAKKLFAGMGDYLLMVSHTDTSFPAEKEMMDLWEAAEGAEVAAYQEESLPDTLMERPAATAKVISKKKLKKYGATEYILENGARIIMKKTDFEKDVIYMNVSSNGGFTYVADEDMPSAAICDNYVWFSGMNGYTNSQVQKILSDKVFSANWGMNRWGEYFNGSGNNKDFEMALQILYQFFMNPQFNDDGWNYLYQNIAFQAKNFGASVNDVINEQTKKFFYDNKPYYVNFDMPFLQALDKDKAEKIFRERFTNIADYRFVFTGDFNEKQLLELCRSYIGSIPGDKSKTEECKFVYYSLPEGEMTSAVKKGSENQSFVRMMFRGNLPAAADVNEVFLDNEMLDQLSNLMDTRLREVLREDLSGTYGVGVSASIDGYPERQYTITVEFGCAPDRVMEMKDKVLETVAELQNAPVDASYTSNLAEIYRRGMEKNVYDNNWWINRIKGVFYDTTEPESVIDDVKKKIPDMITPERMQELAKKYLDTNNYFFGYLIPEK